MHPRGPNPRFLRLAASALATLGLLGHGLAMLLVTVLAAPSAAGDAGFPRYVEICAADGQTRLAWTGSGGREDPAGPAGGPAAPAHDPGPVKSCPVCTAFAQAGLADLPLPVVRSRTVCRTATWSLALEAPALGRDGLRAQSRGPPARA
ncbi:MAG: hypothetical protein ACFB13_05810 [Kiloniellaceae bacterium]